MGVDREKDKNPAKTKAKQGSRLKRIKKLFDRLLPIRPFQEIKSLDRGCHSISTVHAVAFNTQNCRPASYTDRGQSKFVRKGHQQLYLLMLNNWEVGIEKHTTRAYIARSSPNLKAGVGQNKRDRKLEGKAL